MPKVLPPALVDLSAREGHFLDHLAPVWRALPAEHRGTIFVGSRDMVDRARRLELVGPVVVGDVMRGKTLGPVLVAAYGDLRVASRSRRPVVLFEHGAGQSYGGRHKSYVGGTERDRVRLFVVPNEQAAARNRRYYPSTPNAVVGSPRVDELARIPAPTGPPVAAVSFHWRCAVCPETGTAFDDFVDELEATAERLSDQGVTLLGHGHPRILDELRPAYQRAGIEVVDTFDELVARAHVYAVDNSSTLFEFAALDRPVVLLNARAYRRNVTHGLRFWSEADIGVQAEPGELARAVLRALDDPDAVAGSRRAAVARAYSVADGTSAERAAEAIVSTLLGGRRSCPVCGAAHASCGPVTDVRGIDERVKERETMAGTLKRYPNPARPGSFLKLKDETARALGLDPATGTERPRSKPAVDVTNPGGADLVSSATVSPPAEPASNIPKGALTPSGPTHRARAAAAANAAATTTEEDVEPQQDDQEGEDVDAGATSEPVSEPRPSSRRRRAVVDNPQA